MKFPAFLCGLLALCAAFAAPARAADTMAADFHCMVVGTIMSDADNEQIKNAGLFITIYYLGRLDGSGKEVDFKSGYKTEIAKIPMEAMESEAKTCSALLTSRGATLSAMDKDAAAAGKPAPPATPGPADTAPAANPAP